MNNNTTAPNQRLTIITKNGCIRLGWVEEPQASPDPSDPIQLELDVNQSTTDNDRQNK